MDLPQECSYPFEWKRTKRLGVVRLCNVRTTGYDHFVAPAKAFRILVDYPWDKDHTIDEDRIRAANARKQNGNQYTVCWLPRHFDKQEEELVGELCAVRYLLSEKGQDELLRDLGHQDRQTILKDAETHRRTLRGELEKVLARVYVDQGEVVALHDAIDTRIPHKDQLGKNLDRFADVLLERRFPGHPNFGARPGKKELELLREWLLRASDAGTSASIEFDAETEKALRHFGIPLEVANPGQARGTLRLDGRYYRAMEKMVDGQERVEWSSVRDELETSFGLDESIIDVLLSLLCSRGYRPLRVPTMEVVEVVIGTTKKEKTLILERAKLLAPAAWGRARDLGESLLGEERPSSYRALGEQDGFAIRLRERGRKCRHVLSDLHAGLVGLGVAPGAKRLGELKEARKCLEPLEAERTDSYTTLEDFLGRWDDAAVSRLQVVVSRAEKTSKALEGLDVQDRTSLETGRSHAEHGPAVETHLLKLSGMLAASEHGDALTSEKVRSWNAQAHELVQKLIQSMTTGSTQPEATEATKTEATKTETTDSSSSGVRYALVGERVDLSSADAVMGLLDRLGSELRKEPLEPVTIDVILRREGSQ